VKPIKRTDYLDEIEETEENCVDLERLRESVKEIKQSLLGFAESLEGFVEALEYEMEKNQS